MKTDKMPSCAWDIEIEERRAEAEKIASIRQELCAAYNIIYAYRFLTGKMDLDIQVVDAWLKRNRTTIK